MGPMRNPSDRSRPSTHTTSAVVGAASLINRATTHAAVAAGGRAATANPDLMDLRPARAAATTPIRCAASSPKTMGHKI